MAKPANLLRGEELFRGQSESGTSGRPGVEGVSRVRGQGAVAERPSATAVASTHQIVLGFPWRRTTPRIRVGRVRHSIREADRSCEAAVAPELRNGAGDNVVQGRWPNDRIETVPGDARLSP